MWPKRPPSPEARASRAPTTRVARWLARIPPPRISLAAPLGLVLAGLLPGLSCARADESVAAQLLASPGSEPRDLSQEPYAVPGERTEFGIVTTCNTIPIKGWCRGGNLVIRFGASQGYKVVRAWTGHGAQCVRNDWYVACPIDVAGKREQQRVFYELEVEPWSYSDIRATAEGTDGFEMAPAEFTIRMKGKGALRISPPRDMVIYDTGGLTDLPFAIDGPSMNRGVSFSFGPFPRHMDPRVVSPDLPCVLTGERVLECGPVDLLPGTQGPLLLSVQLVPPLPPLPSHERIKVLATSDLTPPIPTDFMTTIPAPPSASP